MASFTNFATLIYNGGTSNSNTVTGELLETLTLTKTAASSRYTARDNVTYVLSLVNGGTAPLTELVLTDDLGGYAFGTDTVYPLTYNEGTLRVYVNGVRISAVGRVYSSSGKYQPDPVRKRYQIL